MKSKENGAASIEATISLTLFIFVIMAIYMLINYCLVQSRVNYAISTTAKEMSQYSYFYHAFGLEKVDDTLNSKKQQAVNALGSFSSLISGVSDQISDISNDSSGYFDSVLNGEKTDDLVDIYKQIQDVSGIITDAVNDPLEFMKSMASLAGSEAWQYIKSNVIAAPLARGMTRRHFGNSQEEANAYLTRLGVENGFDGMNFNLSTLFENNTSDIKIVVFYNLNLTTMLPFDLNINMYQQAVARGWLGGDLKK